MSRDRDDIHDGLDLTATRRRLLQVALGAGGAAALGAGALGAFPAMAAAAATEGAFPEHKPWKFAFVNHVTTNPFFVPTQYGIADACALLGCSYQWTGSQKSVAAEMVNAMNTAIAAKVDGIAVCLVDLHAFNDPVKKALEAGIPVFAYNADAKDNGRLAYIGQDLYLAGKALGERIVSLVDEGEVVGFIATPGQLNIQPRLDGAPASLRSVAHARSLGIEAVYQDLALINELNVYRNMFLQREAVFGGPLGILDDATMRRAAIEHLERMGVTIPSVDVEVSRLSGGQRQAIAVARSVYQKAKILLLDEPTAAMGAKESALILDVIQQLKAQGEMGIVIIAHNYAQIFDVCDRINLVEGGAIVFDKPTSETSVQELTDLVVREYCNARKSVKGAPA